MNPSDSDAAFEARRAAARERIDRLEGATGSNNHARRIWFADVYESADGDAAAIPWADLAPKPALVDWLKRHPCEGETALDVACGLGDNAEALASAGYITTAFDLSDRAVAWARNRFPKSPVTYVAADVFAPPAEWRGTFDLVNECYTIQALDGAMRRDAFAAIASFVTRGGRLLLVTRTRPDGVSGKGPPWPLTASEIARFDALGFVREEERAYELCRGERHIPHLFVCFRKS